MYRLIPSGRTPALALVGVALLATSCRYVKEEKIAETGATLEGSIKYGDDVVQFAMIQVRGADGTTAVGWVEEDGRYRVTNIPVGDVQIAVNTAAAQGQFQSKMMAGGAYKGPEAVGKGKVTGLKFIQVPAKYADPQTSGLKTTVNKGSNTHDINIPK